MEPLTSPELTLEIVRQRTVDSGSRQAYCQPAILGLDSRGPYTYTQAMPNVTLYLPKPIYEWLRKQPDKSKLVQDMLRRRMKRNAARQEKKAG